MLQAHSKGNSLRSISRTTHLAYNTVVSIVRAASQQAQLVHNAQVQAVQTEEVSADELWSFVAKNIYQCLPDEREVGDCWIGVSLADSSGLNLAVRVVITTEAKTDCKQWNIDNWGGYERVLLIEIEHIISAKTVLSA